MTQPSESQSPKPLPVDPYSWRLLIGDVALMAAEWAALLGWLALGVEGARNVYGAWVYVGAALLTVGAAADPARLRMPPPAWLAPALRVAMLGQVIVLVWFGHWMFAVPLAWGVLCGLVLRDKMNKMIASQEAAHA